MSLRVLLIPLDDRPPSNIFPRRLAAIAGIDLVVAPRELLGRFLEPGQPEPLLDWLESQAGTVDALLLSGDMLLYGGLVASRVPHAAAGEANRRLERVLRTRPRCAGPCYVFSTITRLTVTASDPQSVQFSPLVFRYCERLEAARAGDAEAQVECDALKRQIPPQRLDELLRARSRNHQLNLRWVRAVESGEIDGLLLPQEDAAERGVHRVEQQELLDASTGLRDRVFIYPGADEAAMLLLARVLARSSDRPLRFVPVFHPPGLGQRVPPYEDRPVGDSVQAQVAAAACHLASTADLTDADGAPVVSLFLWGGSDSKPEDPAAPGPQVALAIAGASAMSDHDSAVRQLLQAAQRQIPAGRRAAVVDAARPNGADPALLEAWLSDPSLSPADLASYAGWNTVGNSLGSVIAHAVALQTAAPGAGPLPATHYQFLFERLVDDWLYQTVVRAEVNCRLSALGIPAVNLGQHGARAERWVQELLTPLARDLYGRGFSGLPCAGGRLADLAGLNIRLPWPRTFEIEVEAVFRVQP